MNVLLTSVGRSNYLIEGFRSALNGRGSVFAADASADAPALQEADRAFIVPLINQPDYLDIILDICRKQKVGLIIPLHELELPLFAEYREHVVKDGITLVISSPYVIDTCSDKWAANNFLKKIGLNVPRTYFTPEKVKIALEKKELSFPLVIKPRRGMASIGIEYVEDMEELELTFRLAKKRVMRTSIAEISAIDQDLCLLIQEYMNGQEFGLDVINDLEGRNVTVFVKQKLAMRAGETDRAITVRHEVLESLGEKIGNKLGHVGNMDCDVFVDGKDCYVLEMNPRFGGGYPFSHLAGADIPAAILAWAERKKPVLDWLNIKPGFCSSKTDRLVCKTIESNTFNYIAPSTVARPQ